MKKIFFALMILSSCFLVQSCSKSSDSTPASTDVTASIAVTANGVNVASNGYVFLDDSVVVTVTCNGNATNSLTNLKITSTAPTFNNSTGPYTVALSGASVVKSAPRWPAQGSGLVTFTATVTGSSGSPATVSITINVAQIISSNPILGNQTSTAPKFYSSSVTNTNLGINAFDLSDVAAQTNYALDTAIDFGYATRKTAQFLIMSPDDSNATGAYGREWSTQNEKITNWPHRNKTRFKLTSITGIPTTGQFDAAKTNAAINALLITAKAGGEPNLSAISVYDTQVYLFKTEKGKYGLMEIISPDGQIGTTPPFDVIAGTVQCKINFFN